MSLKQCVLRSTLVLLVTISFLFLNDAVCAQELIVLKLLLNEEDKGEMFMVQANDNDIWLNRDDLNKTDLKKGLGRDVHFEGELFVPLSSIPEISFQINDTTAALEVTAPPHLFRKQYIDASFKRPQGLEAAQDMSAFLNYAGGYSRFNNFEYMNVSGELGMGAGDYLGTTTFTYTKTEESENAVRLISDLTITDWKNLRTCVVGDVTASSGPLGVSALLAGISMSKNYALSPYFVKYPSLSLSGSVKTPTDVEVYLNDMLTSRERLSPGSFEINDIPVTGGSGTARIVLHDMYGSESIISTPYYSSDRLLKKGVHEYSYTVGLERKNFGKKNFDYGDPALLAFHNYGLSQYLKVGYSTEASKDLINVGASGVVLIPNAGIVDASLTSSSYQGETGVNGVLGYAYHSRNFNARISMQLTSRSYANILLKPSVDRNRLLISSSIGFGWDKWGYLTAANTYADAYTAGTISMSNLSYNRSISDDVSFFMTAGMIKQIKTDHEIMLGLRMLLGNRKSGSISYRRSEDSDVINARIQKSIPTGTGFGYGASVENTGNRNNVDGTVRYQNRYGMYGMDIMDNEGDSGYRLSYAGGMGYIGKSVFFSRPITDSFAKVKVGDLEGVRVYSYNNEIGRTNSNGELIIPNLHSFHENRIDIEAEDIPIDYSIPELTQRLFPSFRSGSSIAFDVMKLQAMTGSVSLQENGEIHPVEYAILYLKGKDRTREGIIGSDGEFYLENVPAGTYDANILFKDKSCSFNLIIPDSEEMIIDLGKNICKEGKQE